jgi:RNA-directed DNA polymerase
MPPHIIDYCQAKTLGDVASYLGLTPSLLEEVIAAGQAPDNQPLIYIRHRIPKRRGRNQFRTVWDIAPPQIRDTHRAFAWRFEDFARDTVSNFPHPSAYGYVRKRNIRDNAAQHAGAKRLLRCDLKGFFDTITTDRLASRFLQVGIQREAAQALAGFSTIEGKLALGLNASPTLANLVCLPLDAKLDDLAREYGCHYTRYADDMAFSGNQVPAVGRITEIIEGEGFRMAAGKMRTTQLGQAHFVTGLSVSDPRAPHVPRFFKDRLRTELYFCERFGIRSHLSKVSPGRSYQKGINRLDGSVRFVASIEPQLAASLGTRWRACLAAERARVSYSPVHDRVGSNATFLIDESEFELDGQRYIALACVTTEQIEVIRAHVMTTLRSHLIDPFSSGKKQPLIAKGLHFVDAPESLRSTYVDFLPLLQFRAYVAFARLDSERTYEALYTHLLGRLLVRRFKSYDRSTVEIRVEQNAQVSQTIIEAQIGALYSELERHNERRPILPPQIFFQSKMQEPAFSLPDALLWIFGRTFGSKGTPTETHYLYFERLRDKYRHIANVDSGTMYSRRHPIETRRPSRDKRSNASTPDLKSVAGDSEPN